jgi:capsular polysaccharide biosynthesis protein
MDFLGDVRRNWVIAALVFAVTMAVTVVVTALQTPVYESTAYLIVGPAPMNSENDVIRTVETLDRRTILATFARMAESDPVRAAAAQQLQLSPGQVEKFAARGSVVPNTNIIRVTGSGPDPRVAASLANAIAAIAAQQSQALYRVYSLRFMSHAQPSTAPVQPDRKRNYIVGFGLALFFGLAAALAAERLRLPAVQRAA